MDMHRYSKAHPNGEWSQMPNQQDQHNASSMNNVNESTLFEDAVSALVNKYGPEGPIQ